MSLWKWEFDLSCFLGKHVHFETRDGMQREGKLTAITVKTFRLNGKKLEIPDCLELNGDPMDQIAIEHIATVSFD